MKLLPSSNIATTYFISRKVNIKNSFGQSSSYSALPDHTHSRVWARRNPRYATPQPTHVRFIDNTNLQYRTLISTTFFNSVHIRFNRNTSLSPFRSPSLLSWSITPVKAKFTIWLGTVWYQSSYSHIFLGLLNIWLFPFLQTLIKLSTYTRRPIRKTLAPLTNLLTNL